jgi:isoquinoline 1-oxidoreductase beta subunit
MKNNEMATLDRRQVLQGVASTVGALVLSARFSPAGANEPRQGPEARAPVTAWIRIAADNSVTLIASQSEMGQGTTTTLAAALADELYLPWENMRIEFAPFDPAYRDPVYNWMFTGNSQSISSFYDLMRKMGAAAHEMLLAAAARQLNVAVDTLSCAKGVIRDEASKRSLTFGQVAADAAQLPAPANPKLRSDPQFSGRALSRWDIPSKVDGSAAFGIDVKRPDMLLAAVRCAPRFGARLARYDASAIKAKPGIVAVVEVPRGLAVVAQTYWQARRALDTAELVWSDEGSAISSTQGLPAVFEEKLATGPFFTHKTVGDVEQTLERAPTKVDALYQIPFQAHATMEPMNCTAHVTQESCEIWVPTQGMEMFQAVAAQVTGLASTRITIHPTLIGGGFGRRLLADFLKQTLIVAMAVKRPVKLIWSREEDMTHDFYRPAMLHRVSGALDATGALVAISHRVVSPSHTLYIFPRAMFPQLKDWTDPAPPPEQIDTMAVEGLLGSPYTIANELIKQHRLEVDVPVSVWRTTGHGPNNFVLESFIDEAAFAARTDPLAFRRRLLAKNPRALKVLDVLGDKSNWQAPLARGRARGLALASAFGGVVASVVELSVAGSVIKLHRIVTVVDCGTTLDPGIATSNILGGIVWGLSGMRTEVTFDRGQVQQTNLDSFAPLHLWETPPAEVHFVESGAKLGGTGELGPVPIHAAVCNAVFAATGKRIRALPISREGLSFA